MSKIYPPAVEEHAINLIEGLRESGFFDDYEIKNFDYINERIRDVLTEKFIDGVLDEEFEEMFNEEEFEQLLKELIAGSILYELKNNGLVNSYDDDDTEEMFFLTEKGKEYLTKETKKDDLD
jgi:hypothetical protein